MKKFALFTMFLGLMTLGVGCQRSVEQERQDVTEAERQATEEMREEQQDVEQARREGQQQIQEERQDVEQARREGQRAIDEEQRELREARRESTDDARRDGTGVAPRSNAPIQEGAPTTP